MSGKPRYVFDTNVTVSAVLFEQSLPGQALHQALRRGELLISQATLAELADVLGRKKCDRYVTPQERSEFLIKLVREAVVADITERIHACRDAKDDKFLEIAVCGGGSNVVTGDGDLLALHPFRGIPILSPAQFINKLASEGAGQ